MPSWKWFILYPESTRRSGSMAKELLWFEMTMVPEILTLKLGVAMYAVLVEISALAELSMTISSVLRFSHWPSQPRPVA